MEIYGETCVDQQALLESMIETIPGYVSWLKSDMTYLGVNKAISETFGVDQEEIKGKRLGFLHQTEHSFPYQAQAFFESNAIHTSFECSLIVGEETFWQLVQAKKYKNGEEAIFIGIDVTEKKRMEAALEEEQQRRIQAAKMASLGEMAASIAHEINSPLSIIQGNAEILEAHIGNREKVEKCAKKIQKTVTRIAKIVKSLKSYSRKGESDPFEENSLAEIIEDTLELCRKKIVHSGIDLQVAEVPEDFRFDCRPTQISQILVNLLNNAADAIEELDEKWIRLEFEAEKDHFLIAVTDSGPGIPPEIRGKLLEPFFTTKGVGKGTGLGLSLSRGITEEHNGLFEINADHPNTRFEVRLPIKHIEGEQMSKIEAMKKAAGKSRGKAA